VQARSKVKFFFVLPGILWVLAFTIYPLIRSLTLKEIGAQALQQNILALAIFGVVIMSMAAMRFRKRLD